MKTIFNCTCTLLSLILLATAGPANASLTWEWSINDWEPTVGQTDSIVLTASLYNYESSSEAITAASFVDATVNLNENIPYNFAFAEGGLAQQFSNLYLNPGELYTFTFGTFTPVESVDPGQYLLGSFAMELQDEQSNISSFSPDRDLWVTVEESNGPINDVPEPSSVFLLLIGLAGVWVARRWPSGATKLASFT